MLKTCRYTEYSLWRDCLLTLGWRLLQLTVIQRGRELNTKFILGTEGLIIAR